MYNPLEDFEPQNPFENMPKIKNPLDWGNEQDDDEDNLPVFKGFKNPFEQDDEYKD